MVWILAIVAVVASLLLLSGLKRAVVQPGEVGLLYRDGAFVRELAPGAHRWFDLLGHARVQRVALLPKALSSIPLDVISKDQFAFRIAVTPLVTVTGDFAIQNNGCTSPMPGDTVFGSSCTFKVVFAPTGIGPRSGIVDVGDPIGFAMASVTGTGVAAASIPGPAPVVPVNPTKKCKKHRSASSAKKRCKKKRRAV